MVKRSITARRNLIVLIQHQLIAVLYMPSTRQVIVADIWTEALGAGALGVITVQRGTILVNRSASTPVDDTGQLIGDTSLDKIYEREADSDSTLKAWVKAVGSSGKAEIVIDEGLGVAANGANSGSGSGTPLNIVGSDKTTAYTTAANKKLVIVLNRSTAGMSVAGATLPAGMSISFGNDSGVGAIPCSGSLYSVWEGE